MRRILGLALAVLILVPVATLAVAWGEDLPPPATGLAAAQPPAGEIMIASNETRMADYLRQMQTYPGGLGAFEHPAASHLRPARASPAATT